MASIPFHEFVNNFSWDIPDMEYSFGNFGNFTLRNTKNVLEAKLCEDGVWRVPNLPEEVDWKFVGHHWGFEVDKKPIGAGVLYISAT